MPTPKEEAFREELIAERDAINDVEGLQKFSVIPPDVPETVNVIATRQAAIEQRVRLIDAALAAMEALDTDGYPGVPVTEVSPEVLQDLQDDIDDMTKAMQGFEAPAPAPAFAVGQPARQEEEVVLR